MLNMLNLHHAHTIFGHNGERTLNYFFSKKILLPNINFVCVTAQRFFSLNVLSVIRLRSDTFDLKTQQTVFGGWAPLARHIQHFSARSRCQNKRDKISFKK